MRRLRIGFFAKCTSTGWRVYAEGLFFLSSLVFYLHKKLIIFSYRFEGTKNLIVHLFLLKRGRYKRPFLHFGMMSILGIGLLTSPILSESWPLGATDERLRLSTSPSEVLSSISEVDVFQTQVSAKPRDRTVTYTVEKGDTLSTIADKFSVSTDTIRWANNLTSDALTVGSDLSIPPVTGMMHRVERGETVYTIAKKYDTETQKIINFPFNDYADLERFTLVEGQMLVVPDGVKPKAPIRSPRPTPRFIASSSVSESSAGFIWPTTGNVTQYPVWYHNAVDIANRNEPDVAAAKSGRVKSAFCQAGGYGCHVVVDHGNGEETLYGHLKKFYAQEGESVSSGQTIGQMGSTGRSSGTHLHFEVRKNGAPVNPLNVLK